MSIMPPSGFPADSKAGHADKLSNEYEVMQHGYSMLEVGGSNKTAPRVRSDSKEWHNLRAGLHELRIQTASGRTASFNIVTSTRYSY